MNDMKVISCSREIAGRNVTLETGKVARQATGSVIASSGDTKVLVTVVAGPVSYTHLTLPTIE